MYSIDPPKIYTNGISLLYPQMKVKVAFDYFQLGCEDTIYDLVIDKVYNF